MEMKMSDNTANVQKKKKKIFERPSQSLDKYGSDYFKNDKPWKQTIKK